MPTRLRYWRERRGLTQMELAQRSAVGVATVRRIEAGHDTYLGTIEKLAKALQVKPWHLIDWSGSLAHRRSSPARETDRELSKRGGTLHDRKKCSSTDGQRPLRCRR